MIKAYRLYILLILVLAWFGFHQSVVAENYSTDPIITVLPFDAILAITEPRFVEARNAKLGINSPVIGVSLNGDSHAYSIHLLNGHEIVNDRVGGIPIATTW